MQNFTEIWARNDDLEMSSLLTITKSRASSQDPRKSLQIGYEKMAKCRSFGNDVRSRQLQFFRKNHFFFF